MKNYVIAISFSLFAFSYVPIFSQGSPAAGKYQPGMAMEGKIVGKVIDSGTGQPVEYAVVAIHKAKDSSLVTGATCNDKGIFSIEELSYGKFYAEVTFVGYKKLVVPNILVIPNQKIANVGTVKLEPSVTNINEVVVTGNKSIEYKIDKKVVDVSSNIAAAGGTLVDALQNTPSVETDVSGNVTLRGNANFTVLIDGKPSPLIGSEALQQIPANLVQNVEIITNPSAKYDAEGTAGIINVIMKKQEVRGTNGIFNVTAGTHDKYSANMNLNYKFSKYNFTLGADFTDMKYYMTSYSESKNTDSLHRLVLDRVQNGTGYFHRQGKGLKLGIDYDITKNNTISFMTNFGSRKIGRPSSNNTIDTITNYNNLGNKQDTAHYISTSTNGITRIYYNLNLDYQLKIDDLGQQLSASAYFNAGPDNAPSSIITDSTYSNWKSRDKAQPNLQVAQNSNESEFRGKVDYALPILEKGKFETGYQGRFYQNNGSYKTIGFILQDDQLNAKDQIQAGYVSFSNSSFVDYQLGFRAEYETREINGNKMNKFFPSPSVHLSKQLPWDLQLQASYTRRINRPRDWNLNPFPRYQSPQSIMIGNTGLRPEISNSYELNLQKKLNEVSFISIESFYKQTDDLMYQTTTFKKGIDTMTFKNLGHDRSIGGDVMLNIALARWFLFNASTNIYNYHIFGQPATDTLAKTSANTWNIKISPSFRLPWGMGIQINYTYNAPTINGTGGAVSSYYSSSMGIRQEMLKRKATLTLMAQNPIGITRVVSTTYGTNTTTYGWMQRESQVFILTFSYRFNNYKAQPKKQTQDDMNNGDNEMGPGM